MRIRRAACPVLLAGVAALLACGWAWRSSSVLAHPQLRHVNQIYGQGPPDLKEHNWNYKKADLPSLKVDHPVLEEKPWWERPLDEWQGIHDSWSEERKARIPGGVAGMEREIARLRAEAEKRVAPVMALSEEEMLRYVPPQSPIGGRRNYCPACQEGKLVWVGPAGWNDVRCSKCREVFPNDEHPADRLHRIKTPRKKDAEFRYHRDERGFNHFFEGLTYEPKRQVALFYAKMFAKAHYYTGKDVYARRVALILERFAEVFPDWCMTNSEHPLVYAETNGLHSGGVNTNFNCGRWGWKVGYECAPAYEYAYDLVVESEEFDRLSEERGRDVRKFIERFLFYENMAVYYSGGWYVGVWLEKDYISQAGIARRAWVLNSADLMHRPLEWCRRSLYGRCHYDGMRAGATDEYAKAAADAAYVTERIRGWSDPPGFKHQLDYPRIEDFSVEKQFPLLETLSSASEAVSYPDGRACTAMKTTETWAGPLAEARRRILPGWGHAVLGDGSGERAVQAHLHFSGDYVGSHRDNLSVMLFAFGREMLPDIGYHESDLLSRWIVHPLSHNTVVVDRRTQSRSTRSWDRLNGVLLDDRLTDCDLEMYVPTMPGMAVAVASGERAYPGPPYADASVGIFRRMQMLVTVDPERPYVVDVFHVKGGSIHDYLLHGSCDHPMSATATLEMEDAPLALLEGREWPEGEKPREWPASWVDCYGLFKNVRRARAGGGFTVSFAYRDRPDTGVRIHMTSVDGGAGDATTEIFLAESPSSRRLLLHPGERVETDFTRPSLIARRRLAGKVPEPGKEGEGGKELESLFIAVIEPFRDNAEPVTVERLATEPVAGTGDGARAIALRVRFPGANVPERTDTVLVSWAAGSDAGAAPGSFRAANGAELDGTIGLVSEIGGVPCAAYLVGGTRLEKGDVKLSLERRAYEGGIASSRRVPDGGEANAFVTPAELPEGDALSGSCMILTLGKAIEAAANTTDRPFKVGYLIDGVERRGQETWIRTRVGEDEGDHGLRVTRAGTEEVYCPLRKFRASPAFVIHRATHEFVPPPSIGPPGGGTFFYPLQVEMRPGDERSEVRYTLDGSDPTPGSPACGGRLTLSGPAVVKARAFREGWASAVARAEFRGAREPERKDAAGLVEGLDYEYWETIGGSVARPWKDEPLRRGSVDGFSTGVAMRKTDFALRYTGYVRAPADGVYEVRLSSEGPSRLDVGGETVARRDLNSQRPVTASGHVALKAGLHRFVAVYVRGGEASHDVEARGFSVSFEGPGKPEFFRRDEPMEAEAAAAPAPALEGVPGLVPGVVYRYYEEQWHHWPLFDLYTPAGSGVAETVALHESRAGPFALVAEGYLDLPVDGVYSFYLTSRDECRAYVDGTPCLLSRGWNGQAVSIGLAKGIHAFRAEYVKFDDELARGILNLDIEGPGMERRAIGPGVIFRPAVKVEVEPGTGPITGPVTVRLAAERAAPKETTLRYTLDGSEPSHRSREYAGPFTVERDTVVKARAFPQGLDGGPVAEAAYTARPPAPDVYASDLEPSGTFSTSGRVQKDRNGRGKPIAVAGKTYPKGLGVHVYSEVVYPLKPEYDRFVAVVGVDDMFSDKPTASVNFVVYVDGEPVARTPVLRPGAFWHLNVRLPEGGQRIKLVADGGEAGQLWDLIDWNNQNVWDYADWADAGFVLRKP